MAFTTFHGPDFAFESFPLEGGPLTPRLIAWHQKAVAAGRVPCVYLTAIWCPPSVMLERALTDERMQRAFRDVDAATFDIDVWQQQLTEAGFTAHTVPVFFIIDADGRRIGPHITGGAWGENDAEHMAPPLERFFDAQRATMAAPTRGAFAPPLASIAVKPTASPLRGIAMVVFAVLVIGVVAWLKVSQRDEAEAAARNERIRQEVEASLQNSLHAPTK
jgi:hypothetical protein